MCGISCIINRNNLPVEESTIQLFNNKIEHRGPNDEGYFHGPNFAFGNRRLAIQDISEKGHQPMHYRDRYVLTFNGEIYNFIELREKLKKRGYSFETKTDTEVILAAFDFYRENCFNYFNGMWALVIFDKIAKKLYCSRDRFGIKPFYYYKNGEQFSCASEIKQFTSLPYWKAKLNKKRGFEFLAHSWQNHSSETFFEEVLQLPPGHFMVYNLRKHIHTIYEYYDIAKKIKTFDNLDEQGYIQKYKTLLDDAIKLRLRSDVPVGTSLSGGLDSSTITCLIQDKKWLKDYACFSVCNENEKYSEEKFIDVVSQKTALKTHKLFPTFTEFKQDLDQLCYMQDEPFWDLSKFAAFQLFKKAKQEKTTVLLNGQGADEVLAGYDKFYLPFLVNQLKSANPKFAYELLSYFTKSGKSFGYNWNVLKRLVKKSNKDSKWLNKPKDEGFTRSEENNLQESSLNMLKEVGIRALLHFEDRNSMAHGIETRLPFMDHHLIEFTLGLPENLKIRNGIRKFILREAYKDILPKAIYQRYDKTGFITPDELWLKEEADWARDQLQHAQQSAKGLIKPELLNLFEAFLKGKFDDYTIFWRAIFFGNWLRIFNVEID